MSWAISGWLVPVQQTTHNPLSTFSCLHVAQRPTLPEMILMLVAPSMSAQKEIEEGRGL